MLQSLLFRMHCSDSVRALLGNNYAKIQMKGTVRFGLRRFDMDWFANGSGLPSVSDFSPNKGSLRTEWGSYLLCSPNKCSLRNEWGSYYLCTSGFAVAAWVPKDTLAQLPIACISPNKCSLRNEWGSYLVCIELPLYFRISRRRRLA